MPAVYDSAPLPISNPAVALPSPSLCLTAPVRPSTLETSSAVTGRESDLLMYGYSFRYSGRAALLVVAAFALVSSACAGITADEQKLLDGISIDRMMSTLERLCSDEFKGRRAGSPEQCAAADYLASQFEACGLSRLNSESLQGYKQPLTMRYALIGSKDDIKATLIYPSGATQTTKAFAYSSYHGNGGLDLQSEIVFVGYGIHDPGAGCDDYAGIDVSGKIVLWLSGQPEGIKLTKGTTAAHKMASAYQHGAVACLMYKPAGIRDAWGTNVGLAGAIADFPLIALDDKVTADLLPLTGLKTGKSKPGAVGPRVRLQVTPVCDPKRPTCNVLGMIPGSDPEVGDEVVLVGGHHDHLGATAGGKVYRGADDNASGTTVTMEIARSIVASGHSPRRTIVFASWTGEEAGLIGSNYFAADPPFPLEKIVSNIEFDMVGVGMPCSFMTTGASAYPSHHAHLSSSAADLGIALKTDAILGASDHLALVRKKVPSSLIFAAGEHPYYHTTRDTPDTINRKVLESAARLGALAAWRAANE